MKNRLSEVCNMESNLRKTQTQAQTELESETWKRMELESQLTLNKRDHDYEVLEQSVTIEKLKEKE